MPVKVLWDMEKIVENIHYLQSSNSSSADLSAVIKELFAVLSNWAVQESQRHWLKERAGLR